MASKSKGVNPSRLIGTFGSEYLVAGEHTSVNAYAFIVQADDTTISTLLGGDASTGVATDNYLTAMNLSGVALKQGALIQAPAGELFQSITIATDGAIIVYK
jgi:hypothetical protein